MFIQVSPSKASLAAQMSWVASTAKQLGLLDDELLEGWALGSFTDYDVLDNIATHGGLEESMLLRHPFGTAAKRLSDRVNNLLTGMMCGDSNNLIG